MSGRRDLAAAVVLYGPDSIVRERARVEPGADGSWEIPLPAPGAYRLVVVAAGSAPLRARPIFHSIKVAQGEGWQGLDFEIIGRP